VRIAPWPSASHPPSGGRALLLAGVTGELDAPVSADASALAQLIRSRHGAAVAAIAFYGSCLRRGTSEGMHDFYAIVDDYRSAYRSRALATANALLPPNVFYLEHGIGAAALRAKYAVVSTADLARACRGETRRAGLWARFAQPVAAAYARDAAARDALASACADAVCTAVRVGIAAHPRGWQRTDAKALWCEVFRATYAAELRPEPEGASDSIYAGAPARFDARLEEAVAALLECGAIERIVKLDFRTPERNPLVTVTPLARESGRSAGAKWIGLLQLVKTAVTFGDWVPYALWKVERHSGVHLEASERQRRHPFLFGWPVLLRAWRSGALR
jgi:hypothetical protein